jgi:hypothetical protein
VAYCDRLNQILIKPQKPADGACNLGDQLHMENPMGYMVVLDKIEYLGFVDVTRIGQGMENPVGINGEILTVTLL